MDDRKEFIDNGLKEIKIMHSNKKLQNATCSWIRQSIPTKYSYHFTWMGAPIIQYPQDIMAMQELIWDIQPDLIIETGVARGGSVIFYASMLNMMGIQGKVIGVDIDIRPHNRQTIENSLVSNMVTLVQGSSVAEETVNQVKKLAEGAKKVLVVLDSMHTHEHVLKELQAYSSLVTKGSYCIVFDTSIEDFAEVLDEERPWGKGNNPKTAVWEFLKVNNRFEIDIAMQDKLQITAASDGYLKCIKD